MDISSCKIWCFDLDGTLLDQQSRYTQVYKDLIARLGGAAVADYWDSRRTGQTELDILAASGLPANLIRTYDRLREESLEDMEYLRLDRPFVATRQLLELLNSLHLQVWIVSHRRSVDRLKRQLASFSLATLITGYFCTNREYSVSDTAPLALSSEGARMAVNAKAEALQEFGAPSTVVMVGDSPSDVMAARKARVASIGVATGCYSVERLRAESPDIACNSLDDLLAILS